MKHREKRGTLRTPLSVVGLGETDEGLPRASPTTASFSASRLAAPWQGRSPPRVLYSDDTSMSM